MTEQQFYFLIFVTISSIIFGIIGLLKDHNSQKKIKKLENVLAAYKLLDCLRNIDNLMKTKNDIGDEK